MCRQEAVFAREEIETETCFAPRLEERVVRDHACCRACPVILGRDRAHFINL